MHERDTAPQIIVQYGQASSVTGQCDCACDCACAEPAPDQSRPVIGMSDQLSVTPDVFAQPLGGDYHLLFNPVAVRPAVVNASGFDLWRAFAQPRPASAAFSLFPHAPREAVQAAMCQMLDLALLQTDALMLATHCVAAPQTLIAWLHVANACNLRCSYCYLTKTDEAMSDETGRQAVRAVFRSARAGGFRAVKLKYAGGEPTLNLPLVLQLHQQAQSLAEQHNLELDGVILSNGIGWTPQILAVRHTASASCSRWMASVRRTMRNACSSTGADRSPSSRAQWSGCWRAALRRIFLSPYPTATWMGCPT